MAIRGKAGSNRQMFSATLTDESINSVVRNLNQWAIFKVVQVKQAIEKYLELMYQLAISLVPVDTGALHGSIRTELQQYGGLLFGQVVAGNDKDVDYAAFVELGTMFTAAQPYMEPAFEAYAMDLYNELQAIVRS